MDLPGHGASSFVESISPALLSIEIKNILDKEKIKDAYFVGLSLGSMVCAHFAIIYPAYVKKIIFAASVIQVNLFCKIYAIIARCFYKHLPYKLLYRLAIYAVAPQKQYKQDRVAIRNGFDKMGKKNLVEWVKYMTLVLDGDKLMYSLSHLNKPYRFISGSRDVFFLSGSKKTANILVDEGIFILDKAGHMCNRDAAEKFNGIVHSFLN